MRTILNILANKAVDYLNDYFLKETWKDIFEESGEFSALQDVLKLWAQNSSNPLVLFINEIDSLVGDTLISVLRQPRKIIDVYIKDYNLKTGNGVLLFFPDWQSILFFRRAFASLYRFPGDGNFKLVKGQARYLPAPVCPDVLLIVFHFFAKIKKDRF